MNKEMEMNEQLSDRELDALVAEKVMGYKTRTVEANDMLLLCAVDHCDDRDWIYEGEKYVWKEMKDHQPEWRIPNYSTDISAAMEVVEKMRERFDFRCNTNETDYSASFSTRTLDREWWERDVSLPRAICLAALAAINGDDPKP